ncbi:MAG: hypothetical protein IJI10_05795, partial [Eubacterium sp.]|nr:hypothetical protein [Eubacterium sp.]
GYAHIHCMKGGLFLLSLRHPTFIYSEISQTLRSFTGRGSTLRLFTLPEKHGFFFLTGKYGKTRE